MKISAPALTNSSSLDSERCKSPKVSWILLSFLPDYHYYYYYYYYYYLLLESFFKSVIVDGFSQEFEWQQVFFRGQPGQQSPHFCKFSFLLIIIGSGLLAEIMWSVCMSKSDRSLCVSFSRTKGCVLHIPFVRMVQFKFLAQLQVDHFAHPAVSSLILLLG